MSQSSQSSSDSSNPPTAGNAHVSFPGTSTSAATPAAPGSTAQPLTRLQPAPGEWIDCPNCHKRAQTQVQGRSEGKKKFMNIFWWPLPNREHWWEETKWFCGSCNVQLAAQKHGKNIQVLV